MPTSSTTSYYTVTPTPIGPLLVAGIDGRALIAIRFPRRGRPAAPEPGWREDAAPLRGAVRQLAAYFVGELRTFDLRLEPRGTPFQLAVWDALRRIPYGRTTSYGEIARELGRPAAVRAVGAANGRNPLPIVIPCHRVIGADGSLTGFGGGLGLKRRLLEIEGVLQPEAALPGLALRCR